MLSRRRKKKIQSQPSPDDKSIEINEAPVIPTPTVSTPPPVIPTPTVTEKATVPAQIATNSPGQPRISIKKALMGIAEESNNKKEFDESLDNPFTLEQAQENWMAYAKLIARKKVRLSHTLSDQKLILTDKHLLTFVVFNESQKADIQTELPLIMDFLRNKLHNNLIQLEIIIKEPDKQDLIFHPTERFELFKEMSEPFSELAQTLDLQVQI